MYSLFLYQGSKRRLGSSLPFVHVVASGYNRKWMGCVLYISMIMHIHDVHTSSIYLQERIYCGAKCSSLPFCISIPSSLGYSSLLIRSKEKSHRVSFLSSSTSSSKVFILSFLVFSHCRRPLYAPNTIPSLPSPTGLQKISSRSVLCRAPTSHPPFPSFPYWSL